MVYVAAVPFEPGLVPVPPFPFVQAVPAMTSVTIVPDVSVLYTSTTTPPFPPSHLEPPPPHPTPNCVLPPPQFHPSHPLPPLPPIACKSVLEAVITVFANTTTFQPFHPEPPPPPPPPPRPSHPVPLLLPPPPPPPPALALPALFQNCVSVPERKHAKFLAEL